MVISKQSVTLVLCYFAMAVVAESGDFKVSQMLKKKQFGTTKTPKKMKKIKKGKVLKGKRTSGPTNPTTPNPDAKVWPPIFTQFT
eukprot:CAMPEP_0194308292 /NCGR_PEP_ID=MMETSP0171-20130528/5260_1 /TAXON_ID=218684 /ORGANISM="Corethron pennatum, Strain L29A3" /LENGTH=84 /DNA_ID=CAMNT_0039060843 /DNA_START=36 /DNA_END=286 /DNA_ORIENTATION=+